MKYTFKSFNRVSSILIHQAFDFALKNSKLVNFYYSSNKSTDNSYLEVLPIALIKRGENYQVVALKFIDGEFVLRRYNLDRISDFSVSDFSVHDSPIWCNVVDYEDLATVDDVNTVMAIDLESLTVAKKKCVAFTLKSNTDVVFIESSIGTHFVSKKTVLMLPENLALPYAAINVVDVLCSGEKFEDFNVGDVVTFNLISGGWEKLSMTVIDKDQGTAELVLCGIDKNREIYEVRVPYSVVSKKGSKSKTKSDWD